MPRSPGYRRSRTRASTSPLRDDCSGPDICTTAASMTVPRDTKVLLVGDFPPPNGGVATHVEELLRAVRDGGGKCEVLDIGKGQLPADGVVPAGGPAAFSRQLATHAARGYRVHLHTSGANPKAW